MAAESIFREYAEQAGWSEDSQIDVLLEFIERHCDEALFDEHLRAQLEFESNPDGNDEDDEGVDLL